MRPVRNIVGVTLIELMVALALGALVVALTLQFYTRLHRDYQAQSAVSETQQQLAQLHTSLARTLRSAGSSDGIFPGGLIGGRLWMPTNATTRIIGGSDPISLPGGASPLLGFGFVSNNWNNRADVFDVTYFVSGESDQQGAARHTAVTVTGLGTWDTGNLVCDVPGTGSPDFNCAEINVGSDTTWITDVQNDITGAIGLYFVLSNGYHGCLVQLMGTSSEPAVHWSGGINQALSGYCGNDANNGPFSSGATAATNYCGTGSGYSARACYLFEFGHTGASLSTNDLGPARLRRYYVCGPGGTLAGLPCRNSDGSGTYTPTISELHAIMVDGYAAPRDSVVAMGIEDAQVSWKLHEFANSCGGSGNCPCPAAMDATLKAAPHVTSAKYDSVPPAVVSGGTTETEDGCDDEARWVRRVTLTLLAVTDIPYGTFSTSQNRAGLRGLNSTFGGADDLTGTTGASYLRRILRIDAYLRNIGQ